MGGSKVKICKCGHAKDSHKKNPKSRLSSASFCRDCKCDTYLNREKPTKSDVALTIYCVTLFLIVAVTVVFAILELETVMEPIADQQVSMTNGDFYSMVQLFLLLMLVLFSSWFVINPILTDYHNKKRPKYPIDDSHE